VAAKLRAWSELKPSWPVNATVNTQPEPTVPNVACGRIRVAVSLGSSTTNCGQPSDAFDGASHWGDLNP
jgi:hypothetical protein